MFSSRSGQKRCRKRGIEKPKVYAAQVYTLIVFVYREETNSGIYNSNVLFDTNEGKKMEIFYIFFIIYVLIRCVCRIETSFGLYTNSGFAGGCVYIYYVISNVFVAGDG